MKTCQINPGILPIPRTNYGAIESIIWEYATYLKSDIRYPAEIKPGMYDIVHVNVANQALMLAERNIPYIFHMHDHHTVRWGKTSSCFLENQKAIQKSIISLVPAEYLVNYFDHPYKTFYFSHGVNTNFFKPSPTSTGKQLLCVANNGYADDLTADRKGFEMAIKVAQSLNMEITIAGPTQNNQAYFEKLRPTYNKLSVLYDFNDEKLRDLYSNHSIFLHLSELEAGHPNLTLLEAMACGNPVIATYSGPELPGLVKVSRHNLQEIKEAILKIQKDYSSYYQAALNTARAHDYSIITKKLENIYQSVLDIKESFNYNKFQTSLKTIYDTSSFNPQAGSKPVKDEFNINFIDGAFFEIKGYSNNTYNVEFIDRNEQKTLYSTTLKSNTWSKTNFKYFINYEIRVKNLQGKILHKHYYEATNKKIYIHLDSKALGDTIAWFPYVEEFRKKHNCQIVCSTFWNHLFVDTYPQIEFVAPGTTVNDMYAMYNIGFFVPSDRFRHKTDPRTIPLQRIASDILGLDYKEIAPKIHFPVTKRIIPQKYVAISVNSTAQAKFWNHPEGWQTLINYLKKEGFKIALVQKEQTDLKNIDYFSHENIEAAINYLRHAEFVIGVSSGVPWLAWALGKKVVMISGFTAPWNEFDCIRIHNNYLCNSCWNDQNHRFDPGNWKWCPRNQDFVCSKSITPETVIKTLKSNNLV